MSVPAKLKRKVQDGPIPQHVAVIMDGNGRWAKEKGLPRKEGHRQGALVVESLFEDCLELKIPVVSLYAFSTENWKRPKKEVHSLFELLDEFITSKVETMKTLGVRLMVSGNISRLPSRSQKKIIEAIAQTKKGKALIANFCLNYGSRDEIRAAAIEVFRLRFQKLSTNGALNEKKLFRKISEKEFQRHLYTASLPDVDLLIRTAGEKRLSNFLLYQSAYAELYFTEKYWPDFDEEELYRSVLFFQGRIRKFGGLHE